MKVAAVNYAISPNGTVASMMGHVASVVRDSSAQGAQLVVLPELLVLEACPEVGGDAAAIAELAPDFENLIERLAAELEITIVAGSHFRRTDQGILNACMIATPTSTRFQTKNKMTMFERDWGIVGGRTLAAPLDRLGALVCYDSEFPEAGRSLAEAGALVIAVPAFTETPYGVHRVRECCRARAIENQVFVIHASLVGGIGVEPAPVCVGNSAIIAPCVGPFPPNGILAKTERDVEGVAIADLNFDLLLQARNQGDVRNWNDRAADCWQIRPA